MPKLAIEKIETIKTDTENLGKRIAHYRKKKGLSQKDLADKIGVDRTVIANYELNRTRVYDEVLARLAIVLKVSTDILLGIKEEISKSSEPSLKIMKRVRQIEELSTSKQKIVLRNIDINLSGLK